MVKDKFSFGSSPKMREVPPGTEARFRFNGPAEIVDTEWGEKYSFPIVLISHDSYDALPIDCNWESKSMVAKEVYNAITKKNPICALCRAEKPYHSVKRYPHGLMMCVKCQDVMLDLAEEAITLQRYRC
jgi:hypothetical protein